MKRLMWLNHLLLLFILLGCQTGQIAGIFLSIPNSIAESARDSSLNSHNRHFSHIRERQDAIDAARRPAGATSPAAGTAPRCRNIDTHTGAEVLARDLASVRDHICTCTAWGTCPARSCSCDELCPDSFDVFRRNPTPGSRGTDIPPFSNTDCPNSSQIPPGFSCVNSGRVIGNASDPRYDQWPEHDVESGYCRGFAVTQQRFNRLGFFNPNATIPADVRSNPARRREYFRQIINDLHNNVPRVIPGFANLYEFGSSTEFPEIRQLLQDEIAREWRDLSVNFHASSSAFGNEGMSIPERNSLVTDLQYRLDHGMQPSIDVSGMNGGSADIHVMLVNEIREENGNKVLCLTDSNMQHNSAARAVSVNPNHSLVNDCESRLILPMDDASNVVRFYNNYEPLGSSTCPTTEHNAAGETVTRHFPCGEETWLGNGNGIGKVRLSHHEDRNSAEQVRNLANFCRGQKDCPLLEDVIDTSYSSFPI